MGTTVNPLPSGDGSGRRQAGRKEQKKLALLLLKHFSSQPALDASSSRCVSICVLVYFKMLLMWVTGVSS